MKGFKRNGKFIPITNYKGVRKSRDQNAKTEGIRMKRNKTVPNAKWKLYNVYDDDEPILIDTFSTKNEAVNEAHARNRIDDVDPHQPTPFHYNAHFKLWANTWDGTGYTITKGDYPQSNKV